MKTREFPILEFDPTKRAVIEPSEQIRNMGVRLKLNVNRALIAGKRVILKLSETFESRYSIAAKLERDLWLMRDRFVPRYGGRPWLLSIRARQSAGIFDTTTIY